MIRMFNQVDAQSRFLNSTALKELNVKEIEKIVLDTRRPKGFGARSLGSYSYRISTQDVSNEYIQIKINGDLISVENSSEVRFNLIEDLNGELYVQPLHSSKTSLQVGQRVTLEKSHRAKWGIRSLSKGTLSPISAVRYFSSLSILSYLIPVQLTAYDLVKLFSYAGRRKIKTLKELFTSAQALALGQYRSIHEYNRSGQQTGYAFFKRGRKTIIPANLLPFKGFLVRCLNEEEYIKYIPSLFRCAEVITGPLDRSTDNILKPFNGRMSEEIFEIEFISAFKAEAYDFLKEYISLPELKTLISGSNTFKGYLSGKSCPSGKGATKCFKSEFLSLRNYRDQKFYYKLFDHYLYAQDLAPIMDYINLLYDLELEFNFNLDPELYTKTDFIYDIIRKSLPSFKLKYSTDSGEIAFKTYHEPEYFEYVHSRKGDCVKHVPYIGDILFLEESFGKTRVVARANTFFQAALSGGEKVLSKLLKLIPQDYTHCQDSIKRSLVHHVSKFGSMPYSSDATAWTDRLPSKLNQVIFKIIFGDNLGNSFYSILKEMEYCNNTIGVTTLGEIPDILTYTVGQGMGLLTSWASSAVVHHVLARMALKRAGLKSISRYSYCVLGDDICIANRAFNAYKSIILDIGVEISSSKSTRSPIYCEVAKRLFLLKGKACDNPTIVEVTGLPITELYRLLDSPIDRCVELLNRLYTRDIPRTDAFNALKSYFFESKYGGCKGMRSLRFEILSTNFASLTSSYIGVSRLTKIKRFASYNDILVSFTHFDIYNVFFNLIKNILDLTLSCFSSILPFLTNIRSSHSCVKRNPFMGHSYSSQVLNTITELSMYLKGEGENGSLTSIELYFASLVFLKPEMIRYPFGSSRLADRPGNGLNCKNNLPPLRVIPGLNSISTTYSRLGVYSTFKVFNHFMSCLKCLKHIKVLSTIAEMAMRPEDLGAESNQKIRYKSEIQDRLDLVKLISTPSLLKSEAVNLTETVGVLNTIISSAVHILLESVDFSVPLKVD